MKTNEISSFQELFEIVELIKQGDYEGNRTALHPYFDDLGCFSDDATLVSTILNWRGFAMWRIAVNGFNDSADSKELDNPLKKGIKEFDLAELRGFSNIDWDLITGIFPWIVEADWINQSNCTKGDWRT